MDCNEALIRIFPKIDLTQIRDFIDGISGITDLQKEFYIRYVEARYDLILRPSFDLLLAEQGMNGPTLTL